MADPTNDDRAGAKPAASERLSLNERLAFINAIRQQVPSGGASLEALHLEVYVLKQIVAELLLGQAESSTLLARLALQSGWPGDEGVDTVDLLRKARQLEDQTYDFLKAVRKEFDHIESYQVGSAEEPS